MTNQSPTQDSTNREPSPLTTTNPRALELLFDADVESLVPEELDLYIKHVVEKNRTSLADFKSKEDAKAMAEPKTKVKPATKPMSTTELGNLFDIL